MYENSDTFHLKTLQLKQTLLREFGYPPNATEKEMSVKTHTDISGGATIKGEHGERRKGVYNCLNNELAFYRAIDNFMANGAHAYINELAPTQVRTLFLDLDLVVEPSNKQGKIFLEPSTYVDMVKDVVFPTIDEMFPKGWRENHPYLKFAVACPNKLRDKKGGKKFGAHIRAMQIKDSYNISQSIYLHVDNMLRVRRELIDRLEEKYPTDVYNVDWDNAVDKAPMRNGGMRMIGMRKYMVKCDCIEPTECEKCNFGTKMFSDTTVYRLEDVVSGDGTSDKEHLKRLRLDRKRMWMETSISTPFHNQEEANRRHTYEVNGLKYNGNVIERINLSQDDVQGLDIMKTTTEDGRPKIVKQALKRKKRKKTSMEKQETRMKEREEITEKKTKLAIENFIKKTFTQYEKKVRVDKVIRIDAHDVNSIVRAYLRGPNGGVCQNKKGGGAHQDNTYIDIHPTRGAQQRCFSENAGVECRTKVACRKFRSKPQPLPSDLHTFLFPRQQRKKHAQKDPFHQALMRGLNSSLGYTSTQKLDRLFKRRKKM
jgi:hypothetical protein